LLICLSAFINHRHATMEEASKVWRELEWNWDWWNQWAINNSYGLWKWCVHEIDRKSFDLSEKFYAIEEVNYEAEVENINWFRFWSWRFYAPNIWVFWRMENAELNWLTLQNQIWILLDEPQSHGYWKYSVVRGINEVKAVVVISHDRAL
jgi:hypothetical protein